MPIQIRGELLLAGHAPASIWEGQFHFCDQQRRHKQYQRIKVLRRSAAFSIQQSAISNQPGNSTATDAKHAKEIEIWNYLLLRVLCGKSVWLNAEC